MLMDGILSGARRISDSSDYINMQLISQGILHAIQDLVYIVKVFENKNFKYIYVNEKGMEYAGLTEECYGKTFQDVLNPETAALLQLQYENVVRKKKAHTFCDTVKVLNGKILYYESSLNPIYSEENVCEYIVCVTRDITSQIHEKMELEQKKMSFKSLLEYNNDSILSLDPLGNIMYVNPATYEIFGCQEEEFKNKSIFEYINSDYVRSFRRLFKEALKGKVKQAFAKKYIHQDGHEIYISCKTIPIIVDGEIIGIYVITRDVTEQILNKLKTEYLAYYDQLTGLLNRISCINMLNQLLSEKKKFAFIFIDLDEFHLVNDTFGHEKGNQVLQKVASRLRKLQTKDIHLYREHDDQFVMLIENINEEQVENIVQIILKRINDCFVVNEEEVYLNASIGIVMAPRDGIDETTIFQRADVALERAKEHGKGNYQFYYSELNTERKQQFMMENQLHHALEKNEFSLCYQPQFNIMTEEMIGMEALLRWKNEELGYISPGEFIPLAERTGFILKIDEWVLHEVCKQIREWLDKGYKLVPVAVNISAKHFCSVKLIEIISKALETYEIPSHLLTIEITEGALMHKDISETVLLQLKEKNLNIHLDDFGTGYSSLSYLKIYPIDALKIDRSFMQEIHADARDANITAAIIHLAHTLGLGVIAEGVEEQKQIQFLKERNATCAQGYYFNRPLSVDDIENHYFLVK